MLKGKGLYKRHEDQEGRDHWEPFQKPLNSLNHSSLYGASAMCRILGLECVYFRDEEITNPDFEQTVLVDSVT